MKWNEMSHLESLTLKVCLSVGFAGICANFQISFLSFLNLVISKEFVWRVVYLCIHHLLTLWKNVFKYFHIYYIIAFSNRLYFHVWDKYLELHSSQHRARFTLLFYAANTFIHLYYYYYYEYFRTVAFQRSLGGVIGRWWDYFSFSFLSFC